MSSLSRPWWSRREAVMRALRHHSNLEGLAFALPLEHGMAWEQPVVLLCPTPLSVPGYHASCRVLLFESFRLRCCERCSQPLQPCGGYFRIQRLKGPCGKGGSEKVTGT